jgi:DNA-directed RNA polymerase specialized sigma24 family protein
LRIAFHRLRGYDREVGNVVQLHFFEGHTLAETATRMNVSVARVRQLLDFGEAWLRNEFVPTPARQLAGGPNHRLTTVLPQHRIEEPT